MKESLRQIRSKARREKLVRELELSKPERYVLNRYLNTEKRLSIQKVAGEVAYYYGMPKNVAIPMIRKIRARAYTAKHRREAGGASQLLKDEVEAAAPEGRPQSPSPKESATLPAHGTS